MDMRQRMVQDCAQPLTLHQVVVLGRKTGLAPFPAFPHCKAAVPRRADRLAEHPMHLVMHVLHILSINEPQGSPIYLILPVHAYVG